MVKDYINLAYAGGLVIALMVIIIPAVNTLHRLDYGQLNQLNIATKGEMQSDIDEMIEDRRKIHQWNNANALLGCVLIGVMLFTMLETRNEK